MINSILTNNDSHQLQGMTDNNKGQSLIPKAILSLSIENK
jgi:hypothetical protein